MADDQGDVIAQLRDEVAMLQAAAAVAAAAPLPAGAPAPVLPVFTLAPALADTAMFIDLSTSGGTKHFKSAIEPLTSQPFDFADPSDLQVFLDLMLKKSQVWGWNPILTIPVPDTTTGISKSYNLLDRYGMVPLKDVRAHVASYYNKETKQAQDSFMSCQCLLSSLSIEFLKLITAQSKDYHLPATQVAHGDIPAGPLLLKLVISKAHVDSRATVTFIRTSLTELDSKMIQLDSNITAFNFFVTTQLKSLSARGETTNDLLINLFKGYKVADDAEFMDFIRRKENEYEEGKDVNTNNLMADADAKYQSRILTGKWSAPTKEQGQILALTAQLEKLKASDSKKPNKPASGDKPSKTARKNKSNEWAWKDILPKEGDPVTKDFKGKHYHLECKFHPDRWVCHTSEECSKNPDATTANKSSPEKRRLKAAKLAAALLEEDNDSGDESVETDP